jgi:DNA repair ATPase RecN
VKTAREEYRVNLDDSVSLLETGNMKRMTEFLAKLTEKAKEEIEAVKKTCLAEIDAFKKNYAAAQDDYQRIMPRIDAAAQKFKELDARIIALSDFAQKNTYGLWLASSFSQMQRQQLRELYSEQYRGDVERYRKSLDEKKDQLKGKKSITPQELETEFAPNSFKELNDRLKMYKKEDLPKLWEAIDLIDGIKRNYPASNNSRPDSGRQNRH